MGKPARTDKQREIVGVILAAADKGEHLTVGEIMSRLSYKPSRPAFSCSLRYLEGNGIISREGWNGKRIVKPTGDAYAWFRSTPLTGGS
ncbi:hypothetical protein [Aureimonas sp. AU40]|uniref:hypothetical protein n=1 Tax=Aureimonas sp. AU40 TaxID=1637747 RepID=UPI00078302A1|nr:hypothetical protein [Aureimonas sp. AU40]